MPIRYMYYYVAYTISVKIIAAHFYVKNRAPLITMRTTSHTTAAATTHSITTLQHFDFPITWPNTKAIFWQTCTRSDMIIIFVADHRFALLCIAANFGFEMWQQHLCCIGDAVRLNDWIWLLWHTSTIFPFKCTVNIISGTSNLIAIMLKIQINNSVKSLSKWYGMLSRKLGMAWNLNNNLINDIFHGRFNSL